MHCERCQSDWCWICGQQCTELHYEPTRIFTGCPGLQFVGDGGLKIGLILFAAFVLNPLVFALGPVLFAFLFGFYIAAILTSQCLGRIRNCCCQVLLGIPLFLILLVIAEALLLSLAVIVTVLLLAIASPLLMLYIIYFSARLTYLNCKRLK